MTKLEQEQAARIAELEKDLKLAQLKSALENYSELLAYAKKSLHRESQGQLEDTEGDHNG